MLSLLYFLAILSYNHVQNPSLSEAKTQAIDGFTIELIHRYSPQSPFYNSSMSLSERFHRLVLASNSRHHQIKWLESTTVDTSIISNQGDYLMRISVGTPPVELVASVDTTTDLTWFQCQPCEYCYTQSMPIFNPSLSRTYNVLPCDSQHCSSLDTTHIACEQDQCSYWYSYGNVSSVTRGVMGNDTFSFSCSDGDRPAFPLTAFGCGYEQSGNFDPYSAGVVGLGSGPLSLVSQLASRIEYKFSYCLTVPTSNATSMIRFGSRVETGGGGGIVTTPFFNLEFPSFYSLGLEGISIGQRSVPVGDYIIIASDVTLTYVRPNIFSCLESMVSEVMGMKPVSDSQTGSVICYDISSGVTPPDIVFHLGGGDLILKADTIFFTYDNSICLSIAPTPGDDDPMIFGNMAQVNLEVEYDLRSRTVTLAPKDCACM